MEVTKIVEVPLEDILQLRKEIPLGSLYYTDYRNSLSYDYHNVCDFFEGFCDYIEECAEDEYLKDNWDGILKRYDNEQYLKEWYYSFESVRMRKNVDDDEEE